MVSGNSIERVYYIKLDGSTGTCFTIDIDKKQYFVTAKHVIEHIGDRNKIEIFHENVWQELAVQIVGFSEFGDVAVFTIGMYFPAPPLPATTKDLFVSQDLYFLGFPFGLSSHFKEINRGFPIPLIKKAILSAITNEGSNKVYLLDGFNNPGFSGGPVIYNNPFSPQFDNKVCGIISGYRFNSEPTFMENLETTLKVRANTGIIICYPIDLAIDLIKANPIGKSIPETT